MIESSLLLEEFAGWHPYTGKEEIVSRFSEHEWGQIMPFIDSDNNLLDWITDLEGWVFCWLLKRGDSHENIAFLLFMRHHKQVDRLVMHGGAWADNGGKCLYPRATAMLLQRILRLGFKVHTVCNIENYRAIKFDRALGFRPYRYHSGRVHLYLTLNLLEKSFLFRYINRATVK